MGSSKLIMKDSQAKESALKSAEGPKQEVMEKRGMQVVVKVGKKG